MGICVVSYGTLGFHQLKKYIGLNHFLRLLASPEKFCVPPVNLFLGGAGLQSGKVGVGDLFHLGQQLLFTERIQAPQDARTFKSHMLHHVGDPAQAGRFINAANVKHEVAVNNRRPRTLDHYNPQPVIQFKLVSLLRQTAAGGNG